MSTHSFPDDGTVAILPAIAQITSAIRAPAGTMQAGGSVTFTFIPDLTTTEAQTLTDLVTDLQNIAHLGLSIDLTTYRARKADIDTMRTFLTLATPTQAQAVAALKATIRVTGALVKLQLS